MARFCAGCVLSLDARLRYSVRSCPYVALTGEPEPQDDGARPSPGAVAWTSAFPGRGENSGAGLGCYRHLGGLWVGGGLAPPGYHGQRGDGSEQ